MPGKANYAKVNNNLTLLPSLSHSLFLTFFVSFRIVSFRFVPMLFGENVKNLNNADIFPQMPSNFYAQLLQSKSLLSGSIPKNVMSTQQQQKKSEIKKMKKKKWLKRRHFHFVFNEKCQIKVPKTEMAKTNCNALCDSFAVRRTSWVLEQVKHVKKAGDSPLPLGHANKNCKQNAARAL